MRDRTVRDAKARQLCARICSDRRTETDIDILDLLLTGIELHEAEYGDSDAETDRRNALDELDQELTDGLFYFLLEAVKRRTRRINRIARRCVDCTGTLDEHALGCPWVVIVPGRDD